MKMLKEKTWKAFNNQHLYKNIGIAKSLDYGKTHTGNNVFVGRQTTSNGIQGFVSESPVEDSHCLTIGMVGVPTAFYQCNPFVASQNILVLRNDLADSDSYKFEAVCINKQLSKYSYGKPVGLERFKKDKTILPVNDNHDLDYEYMSEYIRNKQQVLLQKYRYYIKSKLAELEKVASVESLCNKNWGAIHIADIFDLVRGREGNMAMLGNGYVPLVSAKNGNNGLKGFVNTSRKTVSGNCITLNNDGDGGAGLAYYQPAEMALDTHVTALIPKGKMSKWSLLFISECISKLHGFFGHGLSISNKRAKKIKIMLPCTNDGKPDYEYMEQYAKNMMLKKYKQYLAFLEAKEKCTRVQIP